MIGVDALPKMIDSSQLTAELDGSLHYDHAHWMEMRLVSTRSRSCVVSGVLSSHVWRCLGAGGLPVAGGGPAGPTG